MKVLLITLMLTLTSGNPAPDPQDIHLHFHEGESQGVFGKKDLVETEGSNEIEAESEIRISRGQDFQFPGFHGCFYKNSEVYTKSGPTTMSELVLGDQLATYTETEGKIFTKFLGWLDRGSSISGFLEITTPSGRKVTLTENHIIFVENNKRHQPKYAGDVTLEDTIYTLENEKLQETTIASIKRVSLQGYRTPLTETGTLLVDGILCSCYASFDHNLAQIAIYPVKLWPYLLEDSQSQHVDGVRTVVKAMKQIATAWKLRRTNPPDTDSNSCYVDELMVDLNLKDMSVGVADKQEL